MPAIMTTPMSDMTLSVVSVKASTSSTPTMPGGTASRMRSGSTNDLNCATRIR